MLAKVLNKIRQQTLIVIVVAVVLLAAYVSIGRQFMPVVSQYGEFFEQQLSTLAGVPVSIEALSGSFSGFNPILTVRGLNLKVSESGQLSEADTNGAIYFDSATLVLDIPRSIWRRQWVIDDFRVESLEINVEQTANGNWQLQGMSMDGAETMELATVYDALLQISRLDLADVSVNIKTGRGGQYRFNQGAASIRNQDATHYIHATAYPDGSRAEAKVSLEVVGAVLSEMSGQLHVDIPVGNYSELVAGQYGEQIELLELFGGAELWLNLEQGAPKNLVAQPQVSRLALKGPHSEGTALDQLNGTISVNFDQASAAISQLDFSDMHLTWNGINWLNFNSSLRFEPEQEIVAIADRINIDLLAGAALASGFLASDASTQLSQFAPKGMLENLNIRAAMVDGGLNFLALNTNVLAAKVNSVGGSPNLAGMDGYVELEFDRPAGLIGGFGEIESTNFSMGIPNVFTSTWDYGYANGALDFAIDINDGQEIILQSSVIIAESDAVDAHAQFATYLRRYPDGRRESDLDLYVGASRLDGEQKYLYLPDGPNVADGLRNSMEWLDAAVLGGDVSNAGIIYRGSTIPGAPSELKTFQSYFEMEQGQLLFSGDWPQVNQLSALVFTSDNDVDVEVRGGRSMNLSLDGASGTVRQNARGENWISIDGIASGLTDDGLVYLQNAGVGEPIKAAFSSWQAAGSFAAEVAVNIPLSMPGVATQVRLEMLVDDNALSLPDYSLNVSKLSGSVIFDTETGIEKTSLKGVVFGRDAEFALSSSSVNGELDSIFVDAVGSAAPPELIAWPMQSDFVADLLRHINGEFDYSARLTLDQTSQAESQTYLSIESNLLGAQLDFPEPFSKTADATRQLSLLFGFGDNQTVTGNFGETLDFHLAIENDAIERGLIHVGLQSADRESLTNDSAGLVILGDLTTLNIEQWSSFLESLSDAGASSEDAISLIDVTVNEFELYGQVLPNVAMQIEASQDIPAWTVRLVSENILGQVDIPYSEDDYLILDLEYLRLPGDEEDQLTVSEAVAAEAIAAAANLPMEDAVDALVDIDPRTLPKMKFATDAFSIGVRPYGSWQFTLDPSESGAELTDFAFDFRGLRLGLDEVDANTELPALQPHFLWLYDGVGHRSELQGLLSADNMADVLTANGLAAVFESSSAVFNADIQWPGSPAFFAAAGLSGALDMEIRDGRFLQDADGNGALKLISIINFDAIMRRLRFSDDLLRRGLAYDEISANFSLKDGLVTIEDRLVISGPSSLYQITGGLDLEQETISGELYVTLPVSRNIPWIGLLTANIPLAVGAYLFDRIFGDQVNSLTSAVYTLEGPWEGLEPEFKQAFGSPSSPQPN